MSSYIFCRRLNVWSNKWRKSYIIANIGRKKRISSYSYSLSNLIFLNEKDLSLAQIHGIILHNDSILTFTKEQLTDFEEEIKGDIRKIYKDSIVKIWYYKEDNSEFDIEHIPSRFAITIQVPEGINKAILSFLNELELCVINLINKFL